MKSFVPDSPSAWSTFGPHAELLLQCLVLSPENSNLIGQLASLLAVDEDVCGCSTYTQKKILPINK